MAELQIVHYPKTAHMLGHLGMIPRTHHHSNDVKGYRVRDFQKHSQFSEGFGHVHILSTPE